jgi:hypothetical protein
LNARNRTHAYIGSHKCRDACSHKSPCTMGQYTYLAIHTHEPARQRARDLANTLGFANAQRARKKVEALFAELKNQIGLCRLRLRRLKFVGEQFFMAVAAQNIKRSVRLLSQGPQLPLPATTWSPRSQETFPRCTLLTQPQQSFRATLFQHPQAISLIL